MPIEGPLRELDIHDVFQLLDLGRKTGVVRVTSELRQSAGRVVFEGGAVVAALIESDPQPLAGRLLRAGKVREADLARARALQAAGDARRLGDLLVDLGAISRRELDRQARAQIEEVVFDLMVWSEGYFSFAEGVSDPAAVEATIRIATEALLMEAARRVDEWSRIESRVPHLGVVPRLPDAAGEGGAPLELVPFEWEVLAAVDGRRDLRALAEALGRSDFDVAHTLFGLAQAGVIVIDDPLHTPADGGRGRDLSALAAHVDDLLAVGDAESARVAAEEAVAAHPEAPRAHYALGRAYLAGGQADAAAEALQQALRADPLFAPARRMLGLAEAARGRLDDAVETWGRWERQEDRPPGERALDAVVGRWRIAAETLADAIRGRHE
jgi:tetratricopeptide (TPR) repeat protein